YIVLATAVLFAVNFHNIWQFLVAQTSAGYSATVDYSAISPPLFTYLNKFNALALMGFYSAIGTVVYFLAISLQRVFSSTLQEAKEAGYVKPAAAQAAYWRNTIIGNLTVAGLLVGWVIYIFVFMQVLLPRFSKLLTHSLNSGAFLQRAGYLASAIILTAVSLYLVVKLSHLLRHGWRQLTAA
ncbi:MAG TPA: hypothetical protein VFK97_00375, partial [Candidatus Saccharimonadales bacterium]|nr:hypothetical protein [Candidatus Saccharimonadales bacterium]